MASGSAIKSHFVRMGGAGLCSRVTLRVKTSGRCSWLEAVTEFWRFAEQ